MSQPAPSPSSSPGAPRHRGKGKRKRARQAKAALSLVPQVQASTPRAEVPLQPTPSAEPQLKPPLPSAASPWQRLSQVFHAGVGRCLDSTRHLRELKLERGADYMSAVESIALAAVALGFVVSLGQFFR
jgi:hypothetical protein